ncbi:hypothetical protein B0A50_08004 [Salinomyces thailandicus]|uniref:Methyltransferase type 11 domain-containing protein n=1 Tax=Salinomyces thailandicus TaxID=706561 RepID=A0A4U0TKP1_9PEZI|nr:hypothetical protein B0A50_08004 [Salinomyces thailandica]
MRSVLNTNPSASRIIAVNEKVTGPPAAEMLRRCEITNPQLNILDNACGGGILTAEVLRLAAQQPEGFHLDKVVAGDIDEQMLSYVRQRKENNTVAQPNAWEIVTAERIDQQDIPYPAGTFTHIFNNFGVFFCPDDTKAMSETLRALKHGGTAGFTSWKNISWWSEIAQPALAEYIPEAPTLPAPGQLFPNRGWSDPSVIPGKMQSVGFTDVRVDEYSFTPNVEPADFAEAMAVLVKVGTKRLWSEDENKEFAGRIENALLHYMKGKWEGGRWTGKMVAIMALGKKA